MGIRTSLTARTRIAISVFATLLVLVPSAAHAADKPVYRCDAVAVTKLDGEQGRRVEIRPRYTAQNGATLKTITYDFGDQTTPLTTTKTNVQYTYPAEEGAYKIILSLRMSVDGKDKVISGDSCVKTVVFDGPPAQGAATKPATPGSLPNSGPENTIGLFVAVSAVSTLLHRLYQKRRLARDY